MGRSRRVNGRLKGASKWIELELGVHARTLYATRDAGMLDRLQVLVEDVIPVPSDPITMAHLTAGLPPSRSSTHRMPDASRSMVEKGHTIWRGLPGSSPGSADPKSLRGDCQIPAVGLDLVIGARVPQTERNWVY